MFLNYANSPSDSSDGNMNKNSIIEINSCGTQKLYTRNELATYRINGRIDYQLIYIASGKGYFYFDSDEPTILDAGNMILYHPTEFQKYIYYSKDQPEIYWIHFTGADIGKLFGSFGIDTTSNVIASGTHPDYANLFKMIIWELQQQKAFYKESTALYFKQLLILLGRFNHQDNLNKEVGSSVEIEQATAYFYEHYNENINIETYVESLCLSNSSFFRRFKRYTGMTPLQYILDIRLSNAKKLLETTDYSIAEIALIVGYDNALYFSRLFHRHVGMSPKEYRIKMLKHHRHS